jgi:hypothetical protein
VEGVGVAVDELSRLWEIRTETETALRCLMALLTQESMRLIELALERPAPVPAARPIRGWPWSRR